MEQGNLLQIVVIIGLIVITVLYILYSGRGDAITLFLGLSLWTLVTALVRKIGIGI